MHTSLQFCGSAAGMEAPHMRRSSRLGHLHTYRDMKKRYLPVRSKANIAIYRDIFLIERYLCDICCKSDAIYRKNDICLKPNDKYVNPKRPINYTLTPTHDTTPPHVSMRIPVSSRTPHLFTPPMHKHKHTQLSVKLGCGNPTCGRPRATAVPVCGVGYRCTEPRCPD